MFYEQILRGKETPDGVPDYYFTDKSHTNFIHPYISPDFPPRNSLPLPPPLFLSLEGVT
jgi:hypothetical protein